LIFYLKTIIKNHYLIIRLFISQGIFTQKSEGTNRKEKTITPVLSIKYTDEWHSRNILPKSISMISFNEALECLDDTLIIESEISSDESIVTTEKRSYQERTTLKKIKRVLSSLEFYQIPKKNKDVE
jgi:hypothetical protein